MNIQAALEQAQGDFASRNPASKAASVDAAQSLPGGNSRTTLFCNPFPLILARGAGCHVWDLDGHQYIDAIGEFTASITGHTHPVVKAAVVAALDEGINLGGHIPQEASFSQAIKARFPSMQLLRFCNSGTEANTMNMLTARAYTQRNKVMVFRGSYHGGVYHFPVGGGQVATNVPFDFVYAQFNDAHAAEQLIHEHAADLACVMLEGMIGSGGCIPATPEFVHAIRRTTEKTGVLMVLDEVMTSRLAPGGLQQVFGITPDLITLGKYMAGGMTFGAFGGRADIMSMYDPHRPGHLLHAGTFNNNALTMAAGAATMTKVVTPEAIDAMNKQGEALRAQLNALAKRRASLLQWTGMGSMMMAHFVSDPVSSPADVAGQDMRLKELLYLHLLKSGIYTTSRCMINLSMVTGTKECEAIANAVDSFLTTYASQVQAYEA